MQPVTMPSTAFGSTTVRTMCHLPEPSASAPSRYDCGTANRLSFVLLMTVGSTMIISVSEPARMPCLSPNICVKNSIPTRPKIIDGMPVSVSTAKPMAFEMRLFDAYSVRYTAAPTPSGTTMIMTRTIRYRVFRMFGSMPMESEM